MINTKKNILVFNSINEIAEFVIEKWAELSENAIKGRGYFTVALSGGKTPTTLYTKLSGEKTLPWGKTHIFIVDERFVPYENEKNNFHMINDALLTHVSIPKENVHTIETEEASSQAAAEKYEMDLLSFFKNNTAPPQFDLILLGIGEDGHTASLFPGTQAVKEKKRLAVAAAPFDKTKNERISITLPVINNAENVLFLVTGGNKAKIVKEVIDGKNDLLPAAMVEPENGRLFFLLDESAGSLLASSKQT